MVRTRIAPSPTGEDLHIGNLYTAYLNWAYAKGKQGRFIIRIEDTDRTRLIEGSEEKIHKTLQDYGITADESILIPGSFGPYRQSERLETYKKYADELVEKKAAYFCTCTIQRLDEIREQMKKDKKVPKYDKYCLDRQDEVKKEIEQGAPYVVRLDVPDNQDVTFTDVVRGDITINTNDIDDQVLLKADGFPTYHLAVVVDDHLMEISHVIRAEEWIASTPKHILLYKAFGWELPVFVHVPILRNADRSKLSKRKNPVWASYYLEEGYFPEAVLNFLALMGWTHPEGKEIFSVDEFISLFDINDIRSGGPVFDLTKLTWMNGEYIRAMNIENLKFLIFNFQKGKYSKELIEQTVPLVQERIKTLKEFDEYCDFFLNAPSKYEVSLDDYKDLFPKIITTLETIQDADWKAETIGEKLQNLAEKEGVPFGKFFMAIRVAITGKKVTPPLNESLEIVGKEETLKRINTIANR
ncbi:MAG: glutamate--tRNA ligase [Candidatus Roizmanbacteria bacterium]